MVSTVSIIVPPFSHVVEPPVYCLLTTVVDVPSSHIPFSSPRKLADALMTSSPVCVLSSD